MVYINYSLNYFARKNALYGYKNNYIRPSFHNVVEKIALNKISINHLFENHLVIIYSYTYLNRYNEVINLFSFNSNCKTLILLCAD